MHKILEIPIEHLTVLNDNNTPRPKCLLDSINVLIDNAEERTAGGIIIPETAKAKPKWGTVLCFGEQVKGLKVGDRVCYSEFSSQKIPMPNYYHNGVTFGVLRAIEVISYFEANYSSIATNIKDSYEQHLEKSPKSENL